MERLDGLRVGSLVEIRPGYSQDTGQSDSWDEWAGCCGVVIGFLSEVDALVEIKGTGAEAWLPTRRLKVVTSW